MNKDGSNDKHFYRFWNKYVYFKDKWNTLRALINRGSKPEVMRWIPKTKSFKVLDLLWAVIFFQNWLLSGRVQTYLYRLNSIGGEEGLIPPGGKVLYLQKFDLLCNENFIPHSSLPFPRTKIFRHSLLFNKGN